MDYKCFCYHRLTVRWVKDALQADMGSSRKRVRTCIAYIMPPFSRGACCGTSNSHLADAKPAPACGAQKRCAPPEAAECRGHGLQLHIPHPPNSICRTATPRHPACLRLLFGLELLVEEVAGNGDHRDDGDDDDKSRRIVHKEHLPHVSPRPSRAQIQHTGGVLATFLIYVSGI